jgi:outer membrane protein TolC
MIVTCTGVVSARDLSLPQALQLAREHSFAIKKASAQREAYDQNLKAAMAERFPTLSLTSIASYKNNVASLDLAIPGAPPIHREIGTKDVYQTDVRLSVPLFTGGKLSGGIGMASATRDYYSALENAGVDEILLTTRVAYLSLYKADKEIATAQAALKRANLMRSDVQSLYDAGAADSVDILEATLAVSNAQMRVTAMQNDRRQKEIELETLLGVDPEEQITVTDKPQPPDTSSINYTGIAATKPELMAAKSSEEISKHLVALNKSDYFPTLSAFGGYSYGKPNIDQFHNDFNDYFVVGASLNWSFNIGGRTPHKVSMARLQAQAANNIYDQVQEQLDEQARVALENLKLTYQRYVTASTNYRVASDNYRLAHDKYTQGVLPSNRLLEIEASLSEAEATLASTQVDYYIVASQYYYVTGSAQLEKGL